MNWKNVRLILVREIYDQLRDRRMVLLFLVLPVLMYPFLGLTLVQMGQFVLEHPTRIKVVGAEDLPKSPRLIEGDHFAEDLFRAPDGWEPSQSQEEKKDPELAVRRRTLRMRVTEIDRGDAPDPKQLLKDADIVLVVPSDFAARLANYRKVVREARAASSPEKAETKLPTLPTPDVYYDSGRESSQVSIGRMADVLENWGEAIVRDALDTDRYATIPFKMKEIDVAEIGRPGTAIWARVFPVLLVLWALTGAFQPAVDLVAGEKERGTLETLLASPTPRIDIVGGKMLAIMLTSVSTVLLNLLSMGLTGSMILSKLPNFGAPPLLAIVWIFVALLPLSLFFSALCLGLAAFARSTKEGHYYMIPLFLVVMPPVMMGVSPTAELNLGKALIPLTGLVMVLRTLIEGDYSVWPYVFPVLGVTMLCAVMAIRWALDLFSNEKVLFREAERFDLSLWIKSLARDAGPVPSFAMAMFAGGLIILLRVFSSFSLSAPSDFKQFAVVNIVAQFLTMVLPVVVLSYFFAKSRTATFSLRMPAWWALPAAALMAIFLHPVVPELARWVQTLYPVDAAMKESMKQAFAGADHYPWLLFLTIAVVPAICEELAFRGFILSGLRTEGSTLRAVIVSSLFFGVSHLILQQSLLATLVGIVPALMVVATRSLWPGVIYHLFHNGLMVATQYAAEAWPDLAARFYQGQDMESGYRTALVIGGALGAALLAAFWWKQARAKAESVVDAAAPAGDLSQTS